LGSRLGSSPDAPRGRTPDPGTDAVVAQEEELSTLDEAEALIPVEDEVVRSGNVIAVVSTDSAPDYRETVADCVPPRA
jgi:hypothetical protein